jgi:hypothetical protein
MFEQIADVVGKWLKGKDMAGLADHAGETKGIKPGLRTNVINGHAGSHQASKHLLFWQFVSAKPAVVDRTADYLPHPASGAASDPHNSRFQQQPGRESHDSARNESGSIADQLTRTRPRLFESEKRPP